MEAFTIESAQVTVTGGQGLAAKVPILAKIKVAQEINATKDHTKSPAGILVNIPARNVTLEIEGANCTVNFDPSFNEIGSIEVGTSQIRFIGRDKPNVSINYAGSDEPTIFINNGKMDKVEMARLREILRK